MNVDGFIIACNRNNLAEVERMIMEYPTIVNQPNSCGFTGLMSAALHNNTSVMKILLSTDEVDISLNDNIGWTALHYCCWSNKSTESMKLLLQHPRSSPKFVGIKDVNGKTAENIASEFRYTELIKIIKQYLNAKKTLKASPNTVSVHPHLKSVALETTNVLSSSTPSPILSTSSSQKSIEESTFQITIEEIKEAEKELKLQEEELEKVASLLLKHRKELEVIDNEINNQLMKNREELESLYQKATQRSKSVQ